MTTAAPISSPASARPAEPRAIEKPTALAPAELRALAARAPSPGGSKAATSFRALLEHSRTCEGEHGAAKGVSAPRKETLEQDAVADRPRRPRPLGEQRDEEAPGVLEPFRPPSSILVPPPAAASRASIGSPLDRAEAAALAERMVTALRVGRVGRDGHLVQLRLRGPGADLEVRLRHEDGRLAIVLAASDTSGLEAASRLSRALAGELQARGLAADAIEVEDAR